MAWHSWDSTYESYQSTRSTARTSGVPARIGGTVVIPAHDAAASERATLIYKTEQVIADKETGSSIDEGDLVRMRITGANAGQVNTSAASASNVACGFALEGAANAADEIKIRFDGTPRGA